MLDIVKVRERGAQTLELDRRMKHKFTTNTGQKH